MNIDYLKYGFDIAKTIAESNSFSGNRFRLGAVILHRRKIISVGYNMRKTNPFQAMYGKNDESIYLHAETSAILNGLKKIGNVNDFIRMKKVLFIVRVKRHPNNHALQIVGNCRPCRGCMRAIYDYGINEVFHTLDEDIMDGRFTVGFPFDHMTVG